MHVCVCVCGGAASSHNSATSCQMSDRTNFPSLSLVLAHLDPEPALALLCCSGLSHTPSLRASQFAHICHQEQLHCATWAKWRACTPECCRQWRRVGEGQGQLCTASGHSCAAQQLSQLETSSCSLLVVIWAIHIDTDPCHCVARDPELALSGRSGQDSPWPQVAGLSPHNRVFLSTF